MARIGQQRHRKEKVCTFLDYINKAVFVFRKVQHCRKSTCSMQNVENNNDLYHDIDIREGIG
jgi:hypothetical protein